MTPCVVTPRVCQGPPCVSAASIRTRLAAQRGEIGPPSRRRSAHSVWSRCFQREGICERSPSAQVLGRPSHRCHLHHPWSMPVGHACHLAGAVRQHRRRRQRRAGRYGPRRHRHHRQQRNQPHAGHGHERGGRVQSDQRPGRGVRRQGFPAGLPRRRSVQRARHDWPDFPRRHGARGRHGERNGHGRLGGAAAADRQGGREHRAEVGRDHGDAAQPIPQLPGADQPGAWNDADGVRQRGNGHAGAVAGDQRQRSGEHEQLDPYRWRHEHEHLAAEPQHVHLAGRDDRYGQHLDQQLRRRAGHGRWCGRDGRHQVGYESVQGFRRSNSSTATS